MYFGVVLILFIVFIVDVLFLLIGGNSMDCVKFFIVVLSEATSKSVRIVVFFINVVNDIVFCCFFVFMCDCSLLIVCLIVGIVDVVSV